MAFGQQSGPPASRSQLTELIELLEAAGHSDFRDARGPMGFTQRQANGKFTRDEADEFIAALQEAEHDAVEPPPVTPAAAARPRRAPARPKANQPAASPALAAVSNEALAAELQRRGWIVVAP